jgi:hypothetical protein
MLNVGDMVRVKGEHTVTARLTAVGVDKFAADNLVRYHFEISPDDAGILFGDDLVFEALQMPFRLTVPITSSKIKFFKLEEA